MECNFTETLEELLENQGFGTEHQTQSLTEILAIMDKFPTFVFGENIQISMLELFLHKYDIREIGAETEELFLHFWHERANELLIEYTPKIQMWLDHFNDLFKFTVTLEISEDIAVSNDRDNLYYLNPVNTGNNLRVQEKNENNDSGEKHRVMSRDVLQSVWGKTRAQLLDQILQLKQVYNMCLNDFATIFMGIL